MSDTTPAPTSENVIVEVCALVLEPIYERVNVQVEDGGAVSPLVIVKVKVRFWQWLWFSPAEIEDQLLRLLRLIARGRHFRIRVVPA